MVKQVEVACNSAMVRHEANRGRCNFCVVSIKASREVGIPISVGFNHNTDGYISTVTINP
jgi:hypothetical protein